MRTKLARWGAGLLVVTLAVGGPATSGAAHGGGTGSIRVSTANPFAACPPGSTTPQTANSETEPWTAVNPVDPRNVVVVWQQDRFAEGSSRGLVVATSFDHGRTFTLVVPTGLGACDGQLPGRITNPYLSFSRTGKLFLTATLTGTSSTVLVTSSLDGGRSWTPYQRLINDNRGRFNDKQASFVDPRDPRRVYVVWNQQDFAAGRHQLLLALSTDGGTTWAAPRAIHRPDGPGGTVGSQLTMLRDGTLVNVFFEHRQTPDGPDRIRAIRSTDRGETWSPAVTIAETTLSVPYFPDTGTPMIAPSFVPDIAVDPTTGAVYVVWADSALATSASAVALARSTDGVTWTEPVRVDRSPQSPPGGVGQAFLPQVEVTVDGTVAVTYYDFRNDTPTAGTLTDYWMVTCRGRRCANSPTAWTERHLDGPFPGMEQVSPSFGGPFVGTYVNLAAWGKQVFAVFIRPTGDPDNPQDVHLVRTRAAGRSGH